jgi:hypothetical protein
VARSLRRINKPGLAELRTLERRDEVENLTRVDGTARVDSSTSSPSDTPKGQCDGEPAARLRAVGRPKRRSPWEDGGWKHPSQDWLAQYPGEAKPHESIELAGRLTPSGRQRTPPRYQALKTGGLVDLDCRCGLWALSASSRGRRGYPTVAETVRGQGTNVRRAAGVERRNGFGWRERL